MMLGLKVNSNAYLYANCYLLLTRQTPTRSRFACKYAGLEVFAELRELRSNKAIRGIIKIDNHKRIAHGTRAEQEAWMIKKILKRTGVCLLSAAMVFNGDAGLQGIQAAAADEPVVETKTGEILLDGDDIKADNVNGLTYKGFGLLSGNSTSDLLLDYKAESPERYVELMQYLFGGEYPIFTHVKLEMGNDCNNSTGAESATMRKKEEKANVRRNPGWQLAADAKKINPDLKVSILSWNSPVWVETSEDKYLWYKESILAGYEEFGFMVDYINPNTNESWGGAADVANTKNFAKWIAAENSDTIADEEALELFHKIKLVVSDEANVVNDKVAELLKTDEEFFNATDVVGYHYKTADDKNGGMKWLAEEADKEVWNSEEQATFSNSAFRPANNIADPTVKGTGLGGSGSALEMGNTVIKSFVESRRGHVIYQPVIGSFYEGGQYSFKELISARDPWSGRIHYDAGLLILAHISKFAVTGWENEDNTEGIWRGVPEASKTSAIQTNSSNAVNGRNGGENYMTLAAPSKDDFSTVVVNDSEYPMTYTLKVQNMDLPEDQTLGLWETRAADEGAFDENYMQYLEELEKNEDGEYTFDVAPYSAVTVTTLDVSDDEEHIQGLPEEGERTVLDTDSTGNVHNTEDEYLYADNFEYENKTVPVLDEYGELSDETEEYIASRGGDTGAMVRYANTLNGAFEVYKEENGNYVLRQQLDREDVGVGDAWNKGNPTMLIGDFRWTNYTASVDAFFEREAENQFAQIGIRQTGSSHRLSYSCGYSMKVGDDGEWSLSRRSGSKSLDIATGNLSAFEGLADVVKPGNWFTLTLSGEGNVIKAYVNDVLIASYEDANPITSGRVALGSGATYTRFDNLKVTRVKGCVPYYTEYLDNMEMYDLSPDKNKKLEYNDKWTHTCMDQGMYVYQRSASYSNGVGAAFTYTFEGTGMEILGSNKAVRNAGKENESANQVNVTVDGEQVRTNDTIWNADDMCTTYRIDGLPFGKHTVTVEVAQGSLNIDAVAVLGDIYRDTTVVSPTPVVSESPAVQPSGQPSAPVQSVNPSAIPVSPSATPAALAAGSRYESDGVYEIKDISKKTVEYVEPLKKNMKNIIVPDKIKVQSGETVETYKVTGIAEGAFVGCKKLKKVTIGKNVTSIGKDAFRNCKSLKEIVIKSTVLKKVGKNAVKGIHKKAVITCAKKKVKAYKKLFSKKSGFKKTMKVKKA